MSSLQIATEIFTPANQVTQKKRHLNEPPWKGCPWIPQFSCSIPEMLLPISKCSIFWRMPKVIPLIYETTLRNKDFSVSAPLKIIEDNIKGWLPSNIYAWRLNFHYSHPFISSLLMQRVLHMHKWVMHKWVMSHDDIRQNLLGYQSCVWHTLVLSARTSCVKPVQLLYFEASHTTWCAWLHCTPVMCEVVARHQTWAKCHWGYLLLTHPFLSDQPEQVPCLWARLNSKAYF